MKSSERNQISRLPLLDGLRGYAAIIVILYHCILCLDPTILHRLQGTAIFSIASNYDRFIKLLLVAFNGNAAVILFFVLSGVVLTISVFNSRHDFIISTCAALAIKRILRLYPPMFVCIIFTYVIVFATFAFYKIPYSQFYFTNKNLLNNIFLVSPEVAAHTWTIFLEIAVIPLIVLLCLISLKHSTYWLIVFLALSLIISVTRPSLLSYGNFSVYFFSFVLGIAIGVFYIRNLVIHVPIHSTILLVSFFAIELFGTFLIIQMIIASILVYKIIFSQDALGSLLSAKLSLYFGRISYGLYLWHYVFTIIAYTIIAIHFPGALGDYKALYGLSTFPVVLLITVILAHWSEELIERPLIRLGHRATKHLP